MRAKGRASSAPARNETAVEAAAPASFRPLNAHTIAGALSPSGRRSQTSGCIRITVHDGPMCAAGGDLLETATIATLRDEDEVDGVFACTRKERLRSRAGASYLALELSDSSGTIAARAFRDADLLAGRFERGEL